MNICVCMCSNPGLSPGLLMLAVTKVRCLWRQIHITVFNPNHRTEAMLSEGMFVPIADTCSLDMPPY